MNTQTEHTGTSATKAKNKYNSKAYDKFLVVVPKGQKDEIDIKAKNLGYKSRNEFILAAINAFDKKIQ